MKKIHLMYMPLTGLGNYNGYRGSRWLKNRIQIFKQFVVPSLQNQTLKDFTLWVSVRPKDKKNPQIMGLKEYLDTLEFKSVITYSGLCFYDDKCLDKEARKRLINNLHYTMGDLYDFIGECEYVYMTIQPSDDCYISDAVQTIQKELENYEAVGYSKGYIMNYLTKEIKEYNPITNPPFYTIKFKKDDFTNPLRHLEYTSLKKDSGQYEMGTPLPSHEYVKDCLDYKQINKRGFLVGTHGANISTHFNIPYAGNKVKNNVLMYFGLGNVKPLIIELSLRDRLTLKIPHKIRRKLRYWNEKLH